MRTEKIRYALRKTDFKSSIFLTFDIDWCSDEVLEYTLNILEAYNLKATFFVTHDTDMLDYMRKNNRLDLGIHPNFNYLLNGDFRYGSNVEDVVKYYKKIVPDAVSVRSHSVTQSSQILYAFYKEGLRVDSNVFIPFDSGINLSPFECGGLLRVPYFFADDVRVSMRWDYDVELYLSQNSLKVFDFHPIHIFLNTENLERYNAAKPYMHDFKKLKEFINTEAYGTKDFLIDLIKGIKQ